MSTEYDRVKEYLLPNEEVRHVEQIRKGSLILTSRRLVQLKKKGKSEFRIERAIPYDLGIDSINSHVKSLTNQHKQVVELVEEIETSDDTLDCSYLENMPESLTRNAVLDLNTILRDQPIPDKLVHEAEKFLGSNPILLEESLRDGDDEENGVLLAAGTKGYYWIQGKKTGRFMTNVIVDTIEWKNVRSLTYQIGEGTIQTVYTHTEGGKETIQNYQWCPPATDDTIQYPWFIQALNGPWILNDIIQKFSGLAITPI